MKVIKSNGDIVPFDTSKVRSWVHWSLGADGSAEKEIEILSEIMERLRDPVTTEEIHQVMIKSRLEKETLEDAKIAANLEQATIFKNQERKLGMYKPQDWTFTEFLDLMEQKDYWRGKWLEDPDLIEQEKKINNWYIELASIELAYPTVKQFMDKYSVLVDKTPVETVPQAALANMISLHGVTDLAFKVAKDLLNCELNTPTPLWNGVRDGNNNSISCCVIESGDAVSSIVTAIAIASEMTSRKAGIGINLDTRSIGDSVKGGQVDHLGKAPLFRSVEASVKLFTQISRGGSATISIKAIDPDIMNMLSWKTQKIDIVQRIDKVDYSFSYNDFFLKSIIYKEDWYLFSLADAPEVHANFHAENYEDYVKDALRTGIKHTKIKAQELLEAYLTSRTETGRIYCFNVTSANKHTPFLDTITQSNLCQEIALPTKGFTGLPDLCSENSVGEIAFCSLSALNAGRIETHRYMEVAERALRTVDRMIVTAAEYAMAPSVKKKLLARRSVGIGITGLAGFLYQQGLDYDGSEESLEAVEELAELHYYSLLKASIKMSKETGIEVQGIDPNWLPIDTMRSKRKPTLDWESLRGKPRMHSVLVAHMPCESSSAASNSENGLYPSRRRVVGKKARRGIIQFISPHFDPKVNLTAWEVDMIPYYAAVQPYCDQGISADAWLDFTKYPGRKVPMEILVTWFVEQGLSGVKSAYYHNFNDGSADNNQIKEVDPGCEECKM